jgi:hypothetical protein
MLKEEVSQTLGSITRKVEAMTCMQSALLGMTGVPGIAVLQMKHQTAAAEHPGSQLSGG